MKLTSGISILERIILGAGLLVIVVGFQLLVAREHRILRDAQRLSIIRQAEAAFAIVFAKTGSFESIATNGCSAADDALATCAVEGAGVSAATWNDPGKGSIVMATPPTSSEYAVRFVLESGYGTLPKGEHILSPQGIR